jgi:hypothetical protein
MEAESQNSRLRKVFYCWALAGNHILNVNNTQSLQDNSLLIIPLNNGRILESGVLYSVYTKAV